MAFYKNITFLFKDINDVPTDKLAHVLIKHYAQSKAHWQPLLDNSLTHRLKVTNENWSSIELNMLLIQLKFSVLFSQSRIVRLLAELMRTPTNFRNSFIPCMPQDSLFDIHNAIRLGNSRDNPRFYGRILI